MTLILTWRIRNFNFHAVGFFSEFLILKMGVKMNLSIITKNRGADSEIGFLTKSILKSSDRAVAKPTAWELKSGHSEVKTFSNY